MKSKLRYFTGFALILLCSSWTARATLPITLTTEGVVDKTSDFIAYLRWASENKMIDETSLRAFIKDLERGRPVNPISTEVHREDSYSHLKTQFAHYGIDQYLLKLEEGQIYISLQHVLIWANEQIIEREKIKEERQEVEEKTLNLNRKMLFHRIEGDEFHVKTIDGGYARLTFAHVAPNLEMLSDQVKEWHWIKIMGDNPAVTRANRSLKVLFPLLIDLNLPMADWSQGKEPVFYHVDQYVSSRAFDWFDKVELFIDRLNQLSILDSRILYELIEDHIRGDQFRLPSESEWNSIIRDRTNAEFNLKCGNSSEKFRLWTVNGNRFEGFDNDVFELVGNDGWHQERITMRDLAWFQELWTVPAGRLKFENFMERKAWAIDNAVTLIDNCTFRAKANSAHRREVAFRLIRIRQVQ